MGKDGLNQPIFNFGYMAEMIFRVNFYRSFYEVFVF